LNLKKTKKKLNRKSIGRFAECKIVLIGLGKPADTLPGKPGDTFIVI
jgi:hypothetical protein